MCDAFLACTKLPPSVMQPAFGMAEVCTCMTYNNTFTSGVQSSLRVLKASLQAPVLEIAPEDAPGSQCACVSAAADHRAAGRAAESGVWRGPSARAVEL